MSSALFLYQCPSRLVSLAWMFFEMRSRSAFLSICSQDLFKTTNDFLSFTFSFFSISFVSGHVVRPYSSTDTVTTWKKSRFILLARSDFCMNDKLSIAAHAIARRMLIHSQLVNTAPCVTLTGWLLTGQCKKVIKVGDCSRGRPEGSPYNSYYTEV